MQEMLENVRFPADVDSVSELLKAKFGKAAVDRTPMNDLRSGGER